MRHRDRFARFSLQHGVSLIEVLISVLIMAIGLLGAAGMQLNALKYTDSSRLTSQASFIVYDIIDRMRANADTAVIDSYELDAVSADLLKDDPDTVLDADLSDFSRAVLALPSGTGAIDVDDADSSKVTVTVTWSEARAAGNADEVGTFVATTYIRQPGVALP